MMSSAAGNDAGAAGEVVKFIRPGGNSSTVVVAEESDVRRGAMIDVEGSCNGDYRVEQYAQEAFDFSSQYGSDYSISYTAANVIGRPTKYPDYGDFPETFAMRTYGDWWQKAPSRTSEIQSQNLTKTTAHDFIVLHFEDYVIPEEIAIYETFNPGAVVSIWAYTLAQTWCCLWEAASDYQSRGPPAIVANSSRRFAPPIKKIHIPTKAIRLEFNHTHLNYFTEIDAVLWCGKKISAQHLQRLLDIYYCQRNCSIMRKLKNIHFRPQFQENYENRLKDFLLHDLNKFIAVLSTPNDAEMALDKNPPETNFEDMPFDIVLNIFSYLDLVSLFRVGQVSRFFYDVSIQPSLYSELNLKPYWPLASTELLCTLAKRATNLRKLDLSWCGLYNSITATEFKKFIQQRGDSLTHLRLNSCKFLDANCIQSIGIVCDNLKELSLRNCSADTPLLNFPSLANLKNLERLDLFQTVIEPDLLLTILESNRKLKHLNLAFCGAVNMDRVAQHIATYNTQLVSLDMWKSHFLSATGLCALSRCHDLEEVDLGWCLREASLGASLEQFLTNCPKLKKLFLGAVRGLTDADVQNIANLCTNLEQLDLMGVLGISKERYLAILVKCKQLQLLDLSFCDNIDENDILLWTRTFKVNIKYSNVPHELR